MGKEKRPRKESENVNGKTEKKRFNISPKIRKIGRRITLNISRKWNDMMEIINIFDVSRKRRENMRKERERERVKMEKEDGANKENVKEKMKRNENKKIKHKWKR